MQILVLDAGKRVFVTGVLCKHVFEIIKMPSAQVFSPNDLVEFGKSWQRWRRMGALQRYVPTVAGLVPAAWTGYRPHSGGRTIRRCSKGNSSLLCQIIH